MPTSQAASPASTGPSWNTGPAWSAPGWPPSHVRPPVAATMPTAAMAAAAANQTQRRSVRSTWGRCRGGVGRFRSPAEMVLASARRARAISSVVIPRSSSFIVCSFELITKRAHRTVGGCFDRRRGNTQKPCHSLDRPIQVEPQNQYVSLPIGQLSNGGGQVEIEWLTARRLAVVGRVPLHMTTLHTAMSDHTPGPIHHCLTKVGDRRGHRREIQHGKDFLYYVLGRLHVTHPQLRQPHQREVVLGEQRRQQLFALRRDVHLRHTG